MRPNMRLQDKLFECLAVDGVVTVDSLVKAIKDSGLKTNDPRLKECIANIIGIKQTHDRSKFNLDPKRFREVTQFNISLINKALKGQLIITDWRSFCQEIDDIFENIKKTVCCNSSSPTYVVHGSLATYIPQLSRADPNKWGAAVCTVDGQRHSIGDSSIPFCLQSCVKPLMYAIAVSDTSSEWIHQFVGKEPSGDSFNSLKLDLNNQPHNPMINSGALVVTSLVKTTDNMADRFEYFMNRFQKIAGGEYIGFNNSVFQSERSTNDRNLALCYYMREKNCFPRNADLMETLDLYTQLCSIEITCEAGALIAGTLANGGINPLTAERVLDPEAVRNMLSLMHSCGMNEYSGQFAFHVGLSAKSGVSGAVITVIPNLMGICTWSPPLDAHGNSSKGLAFCQELVSRFNFHHYDSLCRNTKKKDPRRRVRERKNAGTYNLLQAAHQGNLEIVKRYHLSGFDMDAQNYDGRTALHLAASDGHLSIVRFLVEQCQVSTAPCDRWGSTPVMEADRMAHCNIVQYFHNYDVTQDIRGAESASDGRTSNKCDGSDTPRINDFNNESASTWTSTKANTIDKKSEHDLVSINDKKNDTDVSTS